MCYSYLSEEYSNLTREDAAWQLANHWVIAEEEEYRNDNLLELIVILWLIDLPMLLWKDLRGAASSILESNFLTMRKRIYSL